MMKYNPFTGNFDIVSPNNFAYNYIQAGCILCIPQYQQMAVHGRLTIRGRLKIRGRLSIR